MTTVTNLLTEALSSLTGPDARQEAEWLMEALCDINRTHQFSQPHEELSPDKVQQFREALQRRLTGEPLAYIIGYRDFWDMRLAVTPDVLIPQPDTETLVEQALARIPATAAWKIIDLGTGSGAVALAIARERRQCDVVATDLSGKALKVAGDNAVTYQVANIQFVQMSWLVAFAADSVEMLVSNPPYIADDDQCLASGDVSREPRMALSAGPEGMDELKCIVRDAARCLKRDGWLLVEHGYQQAGVVTDCLLQHRYRDVFTVKDYAGNDRVSGGRR